MKNIILFLSTSLILLNQTLAADEVFSCKNMAQGKTFSLQFDGPRYADWIQIQYLGQDIKKLLGDHELNLETSMESLTSALNTGTCQKGTGSVLVSCEHSEQLHAWDVSNLAFTTSVEIAPDFYETRTVKRKIQITQLSLLIENKFERAVLTLSMTVNTAHKKNLKVFLNRVLGSLTDDSQRCQFKSYEDSLL